MKAATYPRTRLLIEWLRRRQSTGRQKRTTKKEREISHPSLCMRRQRERERERESTLPRERARHLISEIPNIFKSTGAAAPDCWGGGVSRSRRFARSQRRTSLSTAIKIRIIIIRATAEWSVRSQTKRSSISAKRGPPFLRRHHVFPAPLFFFLFFPLLQKRMQSWIYNGQKRPIGWSSLFHHNPPNVFDIGWTIWK